MSESGEDAEAEYLRLKEAYDALHNKKKKQDSPEQFERLGKLIY